jgi:nucleoside-diphosphate-sugar epimerase
MGESGRRLIPSLIRVFKRQRPPFGVNGSDYRDLLTVDDLSDAIVTCVQAEHLGVINLCSGRPVAIAEIVNQVAKIHDQDPAIILNLGPDRTSDTPFLVGSNSQLTSLGWKPKTDLIDGLTIYSKSLL